MIALFGLKLPVSSKKTAPPYGHRKGWIPRTQEVLQAILLRQLKFQEFSGVCAAFRQGGGGDSRGEI